MRSVVLAILVLLSASVFFLDVPPWRAVGYYAHEPIHESSGLVASSRHKGVYWTLNDSGNPASLYATDLDGKLIREFDVKGSKNKDWEALADDDQGNLWIGEIGNNNRERGDLRVYVVAEPDPADPGAVVEVLAEYRYKYPNENVDAEGMFIHKGMPHIISKEANRAVLYRFTKLDPEEIHTLEKVGELASKAYRIRGASLNKDGTMLAAVTYGRLWIYHSVRPISLVNLVRSKPWTMPHDFGVEACAFDGDDLVLTNEARSMFVIPKYWYERGDALPPRGTIPATDLYPDQTKSTDGSVIVERYKDADVPIRGHHLALETSGPSASMTQRLEIPRDDLWEVSTIVSRGPRYGRFELLVDGILVGSPYDCGAKENTVGTTATFGKVHLSKGMREITIRVSDQSAGTRIGIDGYLIQAASPFAQRFMVLGPFDRADVTNIDEALPPETELNLKHTYKGVDDSDIYWKTADASAIGRLNLLKVFPDAPATTQAYALTTVYSETARDAVLLVGADDQVAVWINGTEIHRNNRRGGASPDEDTVPCASRPDGIRSFAKLAERWQLGTLPAIQRSGRIPALRYQPSLTEVVIKENRCGQRPDEQ